MTFHKRMQHQRDAATATSNGANDAAANAEAMAAQERRQQAMQLLQQEQQQLYAQMRMNSTATSLAPSMQTAHHHHSNGAAGMYRNLSGPPTAGTSMAGTPAMGGYAVNSNNTRAPFMNNNSSMLVTASRIALAQQQQQNVYNNYTSSATTASMKGSMVPLSQQQQQQQQVLNPAEQYVHTRKQQSQYVLQQEQMQLAEGASPVFGLRGGGQRNDDEDDEPNNEEEVEPPFTGRVTAPFEPSNNGHPRDSSSNGEERNTIRTYYKDDPGLRGSTFADDATDDTHHHHHQTVRAPTPFRFRNTEESRVEDADLRSSRGTELGGTVKLQQFGDATLSEPIHPQQRGVATTVLREEQRRWIAQRQQAASRTHSPAMVSTSAQLSQQHSNSHHTLASQQEEEHKRRQRSDMEARQQLATANAIIQQLSESPAPRTAAGKAPKINSVSVGRASRSPQPRHPNRAVPVTVLSQEEKQGQQQQHGGERSPRRPGRRATSESLVRKAPNPQYFQHIHRQRQLEEENERLRRELLAAKQKAAEAAAASAATKETPSASPVPQKVAGAVLATTLTVAEANKTRYEDLRWMLPYTSHPTSPANTAAAAVASAKSTAPAGVVPVPPVVLAEAGGDASLVVDMATKEEDGDTIDRVHAARHQHPPFTAAAAATPDAKSFILDTTMPCASPVIGGGGGAKAAAASSATHTDVANTPLANTTAAPTPIVFESCGASPIIGEAGDAALIASSPADTLMANNNAELSFVLNPNTGMAAAEEEKNDDANNDADEQQQRLSGVQDEDVRRDCGDDEMSLSPSKRYVHPVDVSPVDSISPAPRRPAVQQQDATMDDAPPCPARATAVIRPENVSIALDSPTRGGGEDDVAEVVDAVTAATTAEAAHSAAPPSRFHRGVANKASRSPSPASTVAGRKAATTSHHARGASLTAAKKVASISRSPSPAPFQKQRSASPASKKLNASTSRSPAVSRPQQQQQHAVAPLDISDAPVAADAPSITSPTVASIGGVASMTTESFELPPFSPIGVNNGGSTVISMAGGPTPTSASRLSCLEEADSRLSMVSERLTQLLNSSRASNPFATTTSSHNNLLTTSDAGLRTSTVLPAYDSVEFSTTTVMSHPHGYSASSALPPHSHLRPTESPSAVFATMGAPFPIQQANTVSRDLFSHGGENPKHQQTGVESSAYFALNNASPQQHRASTLIAEAGGISPLIATAASTIDGNLNGGSSNSRSAASVALSNTAQRLSGALAAARRHMAAVSVGNTASALSTGNCGDEGSDSHGCADTLVVDASTTNGNAMTAEEEEDPVAAAEAEYKRLSANLLLHHHHSHHHHHISQRTSDGSDATTVGMNGAANIGTATAAADGLALSSTPSRRNGNTSSFKASLAMQQHIDALMKSVSKEQKAAANDDANGVDGTAMAEPLPPINPAEDDDIWQEKSRFPQQQQQQQQITANGPTHSLNESSYFHQIANQHVNNISNNSEGNTTGTTVYVDDEDDDNLAGPTLEEFDACDEQSSAVAPPTHHTSDDTDHHHHSSGSIPPPPPAAAYRHTETPSSVMKRKKKLIENNDGEALMNLNEDDSADIAQQRLNEDRLIPYIAQRGSAIEQQLTYSPPAQLAKEEATVVASDRRSGGMATISQPRHIPLSRSTLRVEAPNVMMMSIANSADATLITSPTGSEASSSAASAATVQSFKLAVTSSTAALDTILSTLTEIETGLLANRGGGAAAAAGGFIGNSTGVVNAPSVDAGASSSDAASSLMASAVGDDADGFASVMSTTALAHAPESEDTTHTTSEQPFKQGGLEMTDESFNDLLMRAGDYDNSTITTAVDEPTIAASAAASVHVTDDTAATNDERVSEVDVNPNGDEHLSNNTGAVYVGSDAFIGAKAKVQYDMNGRRIINGATTTATAGTSRSISGAPLPRINAVAVGAGGKSAAGSKAPTPTPATAKVVTATSKAVLRSAPASRRASPAPIPVAVPSRPSTTADATATTSNKGPQRLTAANIAVHSASMAPPQLATATRSRVGSVASSAAPSRIASAIHNTTNNNGTGNTGNSRTFGSALLEQSAADFVASMRINNGTNSNTNGGDGSVANSSRSVSRMGSVRSVSSASTYMGRSRAGSSLMAPTASSLMKAHNAPKERSKAAELLVGSTNVSRMGSVRNSFALPPNSTVSAATARRTSAAPPTALAKKPAVPTAATSRRGPTKPAASVPPSKSPAPQTITVVSAQPSRAGSVNMMPPTNQQRDVSASPAPCDPARREEAMRSFTAAVVGVKRAREAGDEEDTNTRTTANGYDRAAGMVNVEERVISPAQSRPASAATANAIAPATADVVVGSSSSRARDHNAAMLDAPTPQHEAPTALQHSNTQSNSQRLSDIHARTSILVPTQSLGAVTPTQLGPRASGKVGIDAVLSTSRSPQRQQQKRLSRSVSPAKQRPTATTADANVTSMMEHNTASRNSFELPSYARATVSSVARVAGSTAAVEFAAVKRAREEQPDTRTTPLRSPRRTAVNTETSRNTTTTNGGGGVTPPRRTAMNSFSPQQYLRNCERRMAEEPSFALRQNAFRELFIKSKDAIVASLFAHQQQHRRSSLNATGASSIISPLRNSPTTAVVHPNQKLLPFNLVLRTIRRHMQSTAGATSDPTSTTTASSHCVDKLNTMVEDLHALLVTAEAHRPFNKATRAAMARMADKENGPSAYVVGAAQSLLANDDAATAALLPSRDHPSMLEHLFPAELLHMDTATNANNNKAVVGGGTRMSLSPARQTTTTSSSITSALTTVEECNALIPYEELLERIMETNTN